MISNSLLLNPKTKTAIDAYLNRPTQVLAIVGSVGAGKKFIALKLAASMVGKDVLVNDPRLIVIKRQPDKSDIAIEDIRGLIKSLYLKQSSSSRRVVIITEAERLSHAAQNALLKTLEQPSPETYFILTVSDASKLLPTIFSRTQKIILHPVPKEEALSFFSNSFPLKTVETAWLISEGNVGQLSQLLTSKEEVPLKLSIETAKSFLSHSRYERLIELEMVAKDKDKTKYLLVGLARILKSLHHSNIKNERFKASTKLLDARKLVHQTQDDISLNVSTKLALLRLILKLQV